MKRDTTGQPKEDRGCEELLGRHITLLPYQPRDLGSSTGTRVGVALVVLFDLVDADDGEPYLGGRA